MAAMRVLLLATSSLMRLACTCGCTIASDADTAWMRPSPRSTGATLMSRYGTWVICSFSWCR